MIREFAAGLALLGAATSAQAADLSKPMMDPVVAKYIFDWSGHYVGVHGLYGTGESVIPAGPNTADIDGFMGGGQIGWNWQNGHAVYGLEASGSFGSIEGVFPGSGGDTADLQWLGMVRGKIGYAFDYPLFTNIIPLEGHTTDHFMVYVIGGLAFGSVEGDNIGIAIDDAIGTGWTIGVGVEKRFWDHLSLTLEYDYVDLGDVTLVNPAAVSVENTAHIFKVGLNFRNLWN